MKTLICLLSAMIILTIATTALAQAPETPSIQMEPVPVYHIPVAEVMLLLAKMPYYSCISADEKNGMVSIAGTPEQIKLAKADIAKIDIPKSLTLVTGMVVVTYGTGQNDKGVDWSFSNSPDKDGKWDLTISDVVFKFSSKSMVGNILNYSGNTKLEILQKPRVFTLDGQQALFFAGQVTYIPTATLYGGPAGKLESIKDGTSFKVTPRKLPNGEFLITIDADVSESSGSVAGNYLSSTSRTIQAPSRVKAGETITVSGLISSVKQIYKSKVPILGDIPLIGPLLFRHSREVIRTGELTMFITVQDAAEEAMGATAERAKPIVEQRTPQVKVEETPKIEEGDGKTKPADGDKPTEKSISK